MQFAPALARGDAVAVSMVWLVASTTVKGRPDTNWKRCAAFCGLTRAAADWPAAVPVKPASRNRRRTAGQAVGPETPMLRRSLRA